MPQNNPKKPSRQTVLFRELEEFLIDREARQLRPRTLRWYRDCLNIFGDFLTSQGVTSTADVTPTAIRLYILHLSERGHTKTGTVTVFAAAKAYLNWYANEYGDDTGWKNPLKKKIKPPKRDAEILPAISAEHFRALVNTCAGNGFNDTRDKAVLYALLDSGVRKQELADLLIGDIDMANGDVLVRSGKGGKSRTTFISAKTRRVLAKYLRHRPGVQSDDPLWVKGDGDRLTYSGLRQMIRRRAEEADIPAPGFHEFRRAFTVNALRAGMDLERIRRMLGHSNLSVLERYLPLVTDDLRQAHKNHSPIDFMLDP